MITLPTRRRKTRIMTSKDHESVDHEVHDHVDDDVLADVLDRDHRTCTSLTPTLDYDYMSVEQVDTYSDRTVRDQNNTNSLINHRRSSHRRSRCTSRSSLLTKFSLHRLGELFLISVCLASFLAKPTMSAPTSPVNQHPKWINPCGQGSNDDIDSDQLIGIGISSLNDRDLLDAILVAAKNAFMHADLFRSVYVKNTFNIDFQQHHESWKKNHYEWLPSETDIPKKLGEKVSEEHLESLELDDFLKNSFTYMQKMAVGLEQVAWDQNHEHGDYRREFSQSEYNLRMTLCEIQMALLERNVKQHEDVTRDLMGDEYRHMGNASYRNLRDWLIFRDYMNGLEYIIQVFEYFKLKLIS